MLLMSSGSGGSLEVTPPPQGLEFQKGSKVNLPQAFTGEARKASGGRAEIIPILQNLSWREAAEVEKSQDRRSSEGGLSSSHTGQLRAWPAEPCHLLSPVESRLGGL